MMLTSKDLERVLRQELTPIKLEVIDESALHVGHAGSNHLGQGTHFRVRIASPLFENKTRLTQHRLIYDALREPMVQGIHALAIDILSSE